MARRKRCAIEKGTRLPRRNPPLRPKTAEPLPGTELTGRFGGGCPAANVHTKGGPCSYRDLPLFVVGYGLEHLTKPKSDQSGSKGEKSQMDISSAFISDEQAPVSMEPGKGSLNNPAVLSKMRGTVHPTSGNAVLYMSHCARLSAKRKIVPFISVKFLRTTSGSPVQISQGRQMIQHIFQHFAIIHIGGSEADNKRNAIAIRYEMMFASRATSIYGVGSCVFAPLFAWMTEPSIQALLQSIFFVSCKFCRMTW